MGPLPMGEPEGFEVGFAGEVGGHFGGFEGGAAWLVAGELAAEGFFVHFTTVGGAENPAAGGEAGESETEEVAVVLFDAEYIALFVAGEGGGIENDTVEFAALFGEAFEPVEGVAFAEIMVGGVEVVEAEVVFGPLEVRLAEVEGGGGRSAEGGADGEGSGVGKSVEDGVAGLGEVAHALAIVALVEEDALGVAGGEVDAVTDAVFEDGEGFVSCRAGEVMGSGLLVLVEVFPVEGFVESGEFAFEGGSEKVVVTGGKEQVVGVGFEKEVGEAVTGAI